LRGRLFFGYNEAKSRGGFIVLVLLYLAVYLICGCLTVGWLIPGTRPLARLWIGVCLGILLMMWLPVILAFFTGFTVTGHLMAFVPLALLTGAAWLFRGRSASAPWNDRETRLLKIIVCVALPLTALGGYLEWTHCLNPVNGSLYVGQSTYGDLPLHLSIITSLRGAAFPPDYSILPGKLLAYPFLVDSFSTSFMLFGASLRDAVVIPGTLLLLLVFTGYMILAERMASGRRAAVLATLFVFLNGGLGFLYVFDMSGVSLGDSSANALQMGTWADRIKNVLNGWYQTPTNHAEFSTYNLRWSNIIADMLIPQRTFLGGWCILMPCVYLLYDGVAGKAAYLNASCLPLAEPSVQPVRDGYDVRQFALLGIMAGGLPLLHTHSFLTLALMSAGWFAYDMFHSRGRRLRKLYCWGIFGVLAACLALPQLIVWTFPQTAGSTHFLRFQFNWVNNSGGNGLKDGYLWFYIKNIGLPVILLILSLFEKDKKRRFIASGAFAIFVVAELILFQPNEYDNNKLFYVWYMLCAVLAADYTVAAFDRLKGLRSRTVIAILGIFVCFCSAALTLARECVSSYQMFSANDIRAAGFVEAETRQDDVFMTWTQHINPVSSLAGRRIVCGPGLWLYYHGFDLTGRENDIRRFYADPAGNMDVLTAYSVDYIMVGSYERSNLDIDLAYMESAFKRVYADEDNDIVIYKVGEALPDG
jgi:hypothetical protein